MATSPRVVVLDHGSGNLRSAERALARVGASVEVTADRDAARRADGLVVPGVGAFAACMEGIDSVGARDIIAGRLASEAPVLGICVGMQVMFAEGTEHGVRTAGLGILPGAVQGLKARRVPHMGWNTVSPGEGSTLFAGVGADVRFYFVHSYAASDLTVFTDDTVVTTSTHGEAFVAAVEHGALSATQFHPEKSGDAGADVLARWVSGLRR